MPPSLKRGHIMKHSNKTQNTLKPKVKRGIILCLLPALAIYTYVVVVPIFRAFYLSFFNWSGGPKMSFIGWKNYSILLKDRFVWMFIFNYDYGLVNSLLRMLGRSSWAKAWLDNPNTIILIVSIPLIWQYIGYYMVIIMSAMTSIDTSIFEVAELDGASGVKRVIYITLPLIKNTLVVAVMLCIAGNMKIFDHIYTMTNGGPGISSMVMALNVYKTTFVKNRFGYGSAMSVAVLALSLLLVGGLQLLAKRPWKKEA